MGGDCSNSGEDTRPILVAVIDSFTRSPLDAERCFPNMREGDLLVGAFTNGQIGYNVPFRVRGITAHMCQDSIFVVPAAIPEVTSRDCQAITLPRLF